ncbi:enoyl-CoA hydratase/isomerase family protein [Aquamicrobium ahrensii]|uniref:3-hydroxyisobutyryl-CoA hydrolase n=1 Tax=Aquamicrobium ahrensii TaxID=469551 RepID=A0ABV2KGJ9_9HYPH
MDFGGGEEIRFEIVAQAGVVTLTRPKALNALTGKMVHALAAALDAWEKDDAVRLVLVKAEGRAFCAGGDIMDVYRAGKAGERHAEFFADEYRMNAQLARFSKPYVALIDGIVMGGGVGISAHGSHRVMTENAMVAMPEVGIGFFPDVGGSHVLSRLPGGFGMYMALTGDRVRYGDALAVGLATQTIRAASQQDLVDALTASGEVDETLRRFHVAVPPETDARTFAAIERHFSQETLEAVLASLKKEAEAGDDFAARTLATMLSRSPTSLKVTWREIREGAGLSMDDCMRMEFRVLNRMLDGHDFYEGIRAALVDKGSTPVWNPPSLEDVSDAAAEAYFAPLGERELVL